MLRPEKIAVFALVLAGLGLTGCNSKEAEQKPEVQVQVAVVKTADVSRLINTEAVIFPLAQSIITPKINAPVKKFYVNRGEKVRRGQLLAELENRDLSAATLDNKGAFDQAEASYSNSVNATLPEEVQKTELDVQAAQQELDAAQKLYSSREDLFKQGAVPRKDLDASAVQLAQARTAYSTAKKHLDSLNAVGKQAALKSAGGQLASARGKLMASEAQLAYSRIISPIDGVVTDRPLYPGEMASTSAPLLTVMDISQVVAKAHVPQSDAVLLRTGDTATISLPGTEETFPATVMLVSPALDPSSTTVEIWMRAPNPKQLLRPGMTAQVAVTAQTVRNALVVPAASLLDAAQGQAHVMVVDAQGIAQQREVKTGIVTAQDAQILSGLRAGETVVSTGAYGLPDKTKVTTQQPEATEPSATAEDKTSPRKKAEKD